LTFFTVALRLLNNHSGGNMFEITESAKNEIRTYFKDNDAAPVRVFIANGCGGQTLALGLDENREGDEVVAVDELTFVINGELLKEAQPLTVDFTEQGFTVSSAMAFESAASGGCGSGGCGSCGC
jgi:Fe-S cluster assembly iron-binding protein IscA